VCVCVCVCVKVINSVLYENVHKKYTDISGVLSNE